MSNGALACIKSTTFPIFFFSPVVQTPSKMFDTAGRIEGCGKSVYLAPSPLAILESKRLCCLFCNLKREGDFLQLFPSEYNSSEQLMTAKQEPDLLFCSLVCYFLLKLETADGQRARASNSEAVVDAPRQVLGAAWLPVQQGRCLHENEGRAPGFPS